MVDNIIHLCNDLNNFNENRDVKEIQNNIAEAIQEDVEFCKNAFCYVNSIKQYYNSLPVYKKVLYKITTKA